MNRIGKYNITRELGRGAMGVVYEGADPYIGRKVAIKTIRFDVLTAPAEQQEAQQRFMREARSAGNLSHPSIVTIYEVGEDQGMSYIAMEFIEGESLESLIAAKRRLPLNEVIELVAQIGDALDYAHRNGVVHRDIKPANILVDKEGRPKIVDFGIARIASSSLTQTNAVLGTPSYMAPEQIAGQKVDHRADLFALGAILYELLTFQRAFPGDNVTTVIYKIMHETPPPPRTFDQTLSTGLDAVLGAALAKDPTQRYQSGRALADHLRNHKQFERAEDEATVVTMPGAAAAAPPPDRLSAQATTRIEPGASGPLPLPDFGDVQATVRVNPGAAIPHPASEPARSAAPARAAAPAPRSKGRSTKPLVLAGTMVVVLVIAVVAGVLWSGVLGTPATRNSDAGQGTAAAPDTGAAANQVPAPDSALRATVPASDVIAAPSSSSKPPVSAGVAASAPKPVAGVSRPTPAAPRGAARQPAATTPAETAPPKPEPVRAGVPSVPRGRVYDAADVDERPRVLKQVEPVYPEAAARLKLQDVVVVKALVGPGGRVEDVQILKHASKDVAFDAAALTAVRQYTFAPARKKGLPVSCWFNVGVPFQMPR